MNGILKLASAFFTLSALGGAVSSILIWLSFKKYKTFRKYSQFIISLLFVLGMLMLASGYIFGLGFFVASGFMALAFWAAGGIWLEMHEVSVPDVSDKIILFSILGIPVLPIIGFIITWKTALPLNINFFNQLVWLNFLGTAGLFLVWCISFFASRLRSAYMFFAVAYIFPMAASATLRFGTGYIWILASSILYLSGILAYIYSWVNHGQSS